MPACMHACMVWAKKTRTIQRSCMHPWDHPNSGCLRRADHPRNAHVRDMGFSPDDGPTAGREHVGRQVCQVCQVCQIPYMPRPAQPVVLISGRCSRSPARTRCDGRTTHYCRCYVRLPIYVCIVSAVDSSPAPVGPLVPRPKRVQYEDKVG